MRLAIMQPYFFPYIGYFQCIQAVDKYILYDRVNFVKKSWMSRNRLLRVNKEPFFFGPELKAKSSFKKISEIELDESRNWRKRTLNELFYNYKKASYFEAVFPLVESVLQQPAETLSAINADSIRSVSSFLEIATPISSDNSEYNAMEETLTLVDDAEVKTKRIVEICKANHANTYINAIGGKALYAKEEFKQHGIDLLFVQTRKIEYPQFSAQFHPYLSILDVLMHNGKTGTQHMLQQYDLV